MPSGFCCTAVFLAARFNAHAAISSSVLFGGEITTLTESAGVLLKELSTLVFDVSWISIFAESPGVGSLMTASVDCSAISAVAFVGSQLLHPWERWLHCVE
jgi:hypothetical protein